MIKWSEFLKVFIKYSCFYNSLYQNDQGITTTDTCYHTIQNHTGFTGKGPILRKQTFNSSESLMEMVCNKLPKPQVLASHAAQLKKTFPPQMPNQAPNMMSGPSQLPCLLQEAAQLAQPMQAEPAGAASLTFTSHYFHFSNFSTTEHHQLCTRITEAWLSNVT